MKILYISNNEEYSYEEIKLRDRELYFFLESGHDILALGRYDFFRFYSLYKKFKPDLIISSWVPAGFIPALFKKVGLIKTPIIHWWDEYYQIQMTNYPYLIVGFLERFTVKNSDVLTTASRYNELRGINMNKKIFYIPHGV